MAPPASSNPPLYEHEIIGREEGRSLAWDDLSGAASSRFAPSVTQRRTSAAQVRIVPFQRRQVSILP